MRVPATIAAIRQETPSTKSFRLDLAGRDFSFLPGQWVDCYVEIDGRLEVAGYSMTSSPRTTEVIDLAVKLVGVNPVTQYLHERSSIGDRLYVDGGQGDFFYRPAMGDSLVLIGGGIGITPLMSIVRYVVEEATSDISATLVHSVKDPAELLFWRQLQEIASENDGIRYLFTVTDTEAVPQGMPTGRVTADMITDTQAGPDSLYYVCGPPSMIEDVVTLIGGMGVAPDRIKYETW